MLPPSLTRRALVVVPFLLSSVIGLTAQKPPAQQPAPVAGLRVERLETDAAATPLGIDDATPRLRWILASDRRNVMQTGCARARRVEARAGARGQGRRVGLGQRHVRGSVGRLRRPRAAVARRATSGPCAYGRRSDGKRLGRRPRGSRRDCSMRATGTASGSPAPSGAARSPTRKARPTMRRFVRRASSAGRWAG